MPHPLSFFLLHPSSSLPENNNYFFELIAVVFLSSPPSRDLLLYTDRILNTLFTIDDLESHPAPWGSDFYTMNLDIEYCDYSETPSWEVPSQNNQYPGFSTIR